MDNLSSVRVYQASRNYNPKIHLYHCSVTFEITMESGAIQFVQLPYQSEDEDLHYFFCHLIDEGFKIYSLYQLGVILGISQSLGFHIKDLMKKGDK